MMHFHVLVARCASREPQALGEPARGPQAHVVCPGLWRAAGPASIHSVSIGVAF